ncbi:MAG: hypothetical protein QNJ22_02555 [Desulfosarcinaceae bacterium]|nr:hypothetical protein [Desulfosarcinaceae bacterium]
MSKKVLVMDEALVSRKRLEHRLDGLACERRVAVTTKRLRS